MYQVNIGVIASFTIIAFLKFLDCEEISGIVPILKRIGESLSSYQGIGNMGDVGIAEYLSRISTAYIEFFNPTPDQSSYMYSGGVKYFYFLVLISIFILIVINLFT